VTCRSSVKTCYVKLPLDYTPGPQDSTCNNRTKLAGAYCQERFTDLGATHYVYCTANISNAFLSEETPHLPYPDIDLSTYLNQSLGSLMVYSALYA